MNVINNIITWLIFGTVIGSLGYIFEPKLKNKQPLIIGICGAIITGLLANFILNIPFEEFSLVSFFVALCGASFLVLVDGLIKNID